ncbi:MAG: NAD(P)/FAD-dependent oxidoreductase [Candidatus Latescibacteria bacterium]|nr:NAD(P)/FAD-dependent oxidoreductase [Candidatus Latescibacterota bacterium]
MAQKVNIIGAGIAGLSAGCYLQMNGYDTEIFELHTVPGGLCTSWKRKDYTFDGCIHWLVGSSPHDNFYSLWNELIDMEKIEFVEYDEFFRVENTDGNCIRIFTDVDKLETELLEKAPEDKKVITDFTNAIRKFTKLSMPVHKAEETYNLFDGVKQMKTFLPYLGALKKWGGMSSQEYADLCKNKLLKKTFELMFIPEMSVLFLIFTLAWMHKKSAGYPIGGSLKFARLIEKTYLDLGGKINYGSKVTKILTEHDSAQGIQLEDGTTCNSDLVISAADGHYTIFEMLGGKYINDTIKNYYNNYETFPSYVQVSLGISRMFEDVPHSSYILLKEPILIDSDSKFDYCSVRVFNFDPTLAPVGKTVLTSMFTTTNFTYWNDLRINDKEKYLSEKERIGREVIEILDKKFGSIKENIEVVDVSTPATVKRYTNNWKGSFEGWILTPQVGFRQMKKTLPGLNNFYMIGQWVDPGGGLPTAIKSGRDVAQIICKKDSKKFTVK